MPYYVDGTKSGLENFHGLLIHSNPKAVHLIGRAVFGEPVTDPETGLTRVLIEPIPGEGFELNEGHVDYHRQPPVPAAGTVTKRQIKLTESSYTQADLKTLIAVTLKVVAEDVAITGHGTDGEIVYPTWANDEPENSGYVVSSVVGSLIYDDGGQTPFSGTFISMVTDEPVNSALPDESLNGFSEPN